MENQSEKLDHQVAGLPSLCLASAISVESSRCSRTAEPTRASTSAAGTRRTEPARSGRPWSRGEESQSGFNSCLPCHLRPRITLLECDLGKTPKIPRVQPFAFLGL